MMLVVSLMANGRSDISIGLLPTYASIGVAAPILMVTLCFVLGFAPGGEWCGAVLMVVEQAEPRRRDLLASAPQIGLAVGLTLSTLVFLALRQPRRGVPGLLRASSARAGSPFAETLRTTCTGRCSGNQEPAMAVARRMRTGSVDINGAAHNPLAPFGGYKQSGYDGRWSLRTRGLPADQV